MPNAYASKICAGKIKDPSGVKRKDFRGSKAEGGLMEATSRLKRQGLKEGKSVKDVRKERALKSQQKTIDSITGFFNKATFGLTKPKKPKVKKMGGGMIRPMYRKGGGVCLRGMNRDAIGKNS